MAVEQNDFWHLLTGDLPDVYKRQRKYLSTQPEALMLENVIIR